MKVGTPCFEQSLKVKIAISVLVWFSNFLTTNFYGLSRHSWSPATTGPPGPSVANYVAVNGPPDQVWLPWMVRFATNGPPLANRFKLDKTVAGKPTERSDCLVKAPCTFVAMANGE